LTVSRKSPFVNAKVILNNNDQYIHIDCSSTTPLILRKKTSITEEV